MAFQPLRFMYFSTFKSIPEWKRDLMTVEAMQKCALRLQKEWEEEEEAAKKAHLSPFEAGLEDQIESKIVDFMTTKGPKNLN